MRTLPSGVLRRNSFDLRQTLHGRPRTPLRDHVALPVENSNRVCRRDSQIDADQSGITHLDASSVVVGVDTQRALTGDAQLNGHGPKGDTAQPRLPLMCCKRFRRRWIESLPSSGASVAEPAVAIRTTRPGPTTSLRSDLNATNRTSPDEQAFPETPPHGGSMMAVSIT